MVAFFFGHQLNYDEFTKLVIKLRWIDYKSSRELVIKRDDYFLSENELHQNSQRRNFYCLCTHLQVLDLICFGCLPLKN